VEADAVVKRYSLGGMAMIVLMAVPVIVGMRMVVHG